MKLRLCKGLSYHGVVTATQSKPVVEVQSDAIADYLIKTGYFTKESEPSEETEPDPYEEPPLSQEEKPDGESEKPLDKLSKSELETLAETVGVDVTACKNNSERVEAIKAAMAKENSTSENLEPDFDFSQES